MIHIGNGSSLSIVKTDIACLLTESVPLKLNNVLHIPQLSKSLLSVSQLIKHNSVIVEFSYKSYFIKDQLTRQILLHDTLTNGFYALHIPSTASHIFHVTTSSLDL
jgi:hypothetical protein